MSHKTKIFFRADGNSQIGLGHVIRSCALAKILSDKFDCHFFIRSPSSSLFIYIEQYCSNITSFSETDLIEDEALSWSKSFDGSEIVVLDGYHFTATYQKIVIAKGNKLVCIDDIHSTYFWADVIINHGGGSFKQDYQAMPFTCFYLGSKYALLRPAFKAVAVEQQREEAILICLGGADMNNVTMDVLKGLEARNVWQQCYVIVGNAYLHKRDLSAYANVSNLKIKILENISEDAMAALMSRCKYAICPPSTVAYEYLTIGGELYLIQIADNQKHVYSFLIKNGLAFDLKALFVKEQEKILFSKKQQEFFFDNKSCQRFIRLFTRLSEEHKYKIRSASVLDEGFLFNLANDSEVRRNSLNSQTVSFGDHVNWFRNKLSSTQAMIYLLEKDNLPVGQVRVDIKDDMQTGVISYSIASEFRGQALGITIIKLLIRHLLHEGSSLKCLEAVVKEDNMASIHVFETLNFTRQGDQLFGNFPCHVYKLYLGSAAFIKAVADN